jgi:2-alkyl-3-oxoalkanoate reductase
MVATMSAARAGRRRLKMKKVLITGATGFLGSHLVERNLGAGRAVRIFALPGDPKAAGFAARGVEVVSGDIRDERAVARAAAGVQIVFHLAAVVTDWAPRKLFTEVNVEGMRNVCRAALESRVERFVEVSTNDIFGLGEDEVMTEDGELSYWHEPYADTKIEATKIAWEYGRKGLPVTMVYPCWVYGPGDLTFVPEIAKALKSRSLVFWRKEALVWPAYVGNVVDLLMVISEHPAAVGQGFLVHDGVFDTFENFSAKVAEAVGAPKATLRIPYAAAYAASWGMELAWKALGKRSRPLLTTYSVKNLGSRLRFSIDKAEKVLGWKPPISYEEGFKRTMEALESNRSTR